MTTVLNMKRKSCLLMEDSDDDDEDRKTVSSMGGESSRKFARQNHSEIEKRRRDKMNSYITELATLIPMCSAMNRKLDKLTVLRMSVQHMKTLRGTGDAHTEVSYKPNFLTDNELKHLILKAADGFLFVVGCDRGRILFSSDSVKDILHYTQSDLIGQSLFDFLHPKDISKVKEQLLSSDLSPRERLIDAKTMLPVKTELPQRQSQLCSGARRQFYCRMKTGNKAYLSMKYEKDPDFGDLGQKKKKSDRKNYSVIHCTGYLKSWPPTKVGMVEDAELESDGCNLSCLVAIGKLLPTFSPQNVPENSEMKVRHTEFNSRHGLDGKFTYVDQRATSILGYLPQELLGTSAYEYYHYEDLENLSETHRKALRNKEKVESKPYRIKAKDGSFVRIKSKLFSFQNPWTKEVEYLAATNTVLPTQEVSSSGQAMDIDSATTGCEAEDGEDLSVTSTSVQRGLSVPGIPGGTRPGAGKIGRQIADEMLEQQKDPAMQVESSTASRLPPKQLARTMRQNLQKSVRSATQATAASATNSQVITLSLPQGGNRPHQPTNGLTVPINSSSEDGPGGNAEQIPAHLSNFIDSEVLSDSSATDGNDEAAMAVIMSLLEADAGLGGPVDFSDLPWPL